MLEFGCLFVVFVVLGVVRYFYKVGRIVESYDFFINVLWVFYLLVVFVVYKMFEWKEIVVGVWGLGVECLFVIFGDVFFLSVVIVVKFCLVGIRILYVREGEWESYCKSYIFINCIGIRCRDVVWDWSFKIFLVW